MKKLLLMFVMLLGSVATMQAQSFDFGCETIDSGTVTESDFTTEDVMMLTAASFIIDMELPAFGDTYSHTVGGIEYFITVTMDYFERDDFESLVYSLGFSGSIQSEHRSLADAIAAYMEFLDQTDG